MRYSTGVIHGRFQGLHNGHIEFIKAGFEKCDRLVIGITNYFKQNNPKNITIDISVDQNRFKDESNPFSFYDRYKMLSETLVELGYSRKDFDIIPFPIENPEDIHKFVDKSNVFLLTIYDEWGETKLKELQNQGFKVEVLWKRTLDQKPISGSSIRNKILSNDFNWLSQVPKAVSSYIIENNLVEKIKNIDYLIYNLNNEISSGLFGGKASGLKYLYNFNFRIPVTYFIKVLDLETFEKIYDDLKVALDYFCHLYPNTLFAIRSSGKNEDSLESSKAGNFKTTLNVKSVSNEILDAIRTIITHGSVLDKVGIIIQEMVNSLYSGVIFSSDPISWRKDLSVVSYVKGLGDKLLSGESSELKTLELVTDHEGGFIVSDFQNPSELEFVKKVVKYSKLIEKKLNYPVDIEWSVDQTGKVYLLQCRPITNLSSKNPIIKTINVDNLKLVESKFQESDKVKIRLKCEIENIHISKAYILTTNTIDDFLTIDIDTVVKSKYYSGFSVVILYPKLTLGKVKRSFIGNQKNLYNMLTCHRFGIRSNPDYNNLKECLNDFYQVIRKSSWAGSIIIQEIYNPKFTGILKKTSEGFVMEITRGHFASKGLVPMSFYATNEEGEIAFRKEVYQEKHISIIEGCTLEFGCPEELIDQLVSLSSEEVKLIINTFRPLFKNDKLSLEFGYISDDQENLPYVIDFTIEKGVDTLSIENLNSGVMSEGRLNGKIVKLSIGEISEHLNTHFYNDIKDQVNKQNDPIIFYAEMPSIKFIELLDKYDANKIAFLFKTGSILCHLAVLLRERKIPALLNVNGESLIDGDGYEIDTSLDNPLSKT